MGPLIDMYDKNTEEYLWSCSLGIPVYTITSEEFNWPVPPLESTYNIATIENGVSPRYVVYTVRYYVLTARHCVTDVNPDNGEEYLRIGEVYQPNKNEGTLISLDIPFIFYNNFTNLTNGYIEVDAALIRTESKSEINGIPSLISDKYSNKILFIYTSSGKCPDYEVGNVTISSYAASKDEIIDLFENNALIYKAGATTGLTRSLIHPVWLQKYNYEWIKLYYNYTTNDTVYRILAGRGFPVKIITTSLCGDYELFSWYGDSGGIVFTFYGEDEGVKVLGVISGHILIIDRRTNTIIDGYIIIAPTPLIFSDYNLINNINLNLYTHG